MTGPADPPTDPGSRGRRPPLWLLRAARPVVAFVLRSRWHRLLSGRFMLLSYVGRRSGTAYTIPITYFPWGENDVLSFSSRGWWVNLRDGRTVTLTIRGRRLDARPVVEESAERRAELVGELVRRFGPRAARVLFLGLPTRRAPSDTEALEAARRAAVIRFRPNDGERDGR